MCKSLTSVYLRVLINIISTTSFSYYIPATQMWCLARILPLMIGKEISEADEHWSNYLVLLEILDYVFAPTITREAVAHLRVLIDDHHQHFKVLYSNSPITPKMHYIVHYPDLILK